ncbi:hypothetical protein HPB51_011346 [Rhipicephalus microplus]|uniref:Uncharacterized protein n=1 Tax=Rhipicephalus microplus TaxID=6941 RepID=A0A9J6DG59_RHIMP|nr:hypothetical protein HPB51_011346 [Rhipicephalus microplus]
MARPLNRWILDQESKPAAEKWRGHRRLAHQLQVCDINTLLVVPRRAPLCLRCRRTGIYGGTVAYLAAAGANAMSTKTANVSRPTAVWLGLWLVLWAEPVAGGRVEEYAIYEVDAEEAAGSMTQGPVFTPLSKGPNDNGCQAAQDEHTGRISQQSKDPSIVPSDKKRDEKDESTATSTEQPEVMDATNKGGGACSKPSREDGTNEDAGQHKTIESKPAAKSTAHRLLSSGLTKLNIAAGARTPPKPPFVATGVDFQRGSKIKAYEVKEMPPSFRRSHIVLIPKSDDLVKLWSVSAYRPISTTNTDYMVFMKEFAKRLQSVIKATSNM